MFENKWEREKKNSIRSATTGINDSNSGRSQNTTNYKNNSGVRQIAYSKHKNTGEPILKKAEKERNATTARNNRKKNEVNNNIYTCKRNICIHNERWYMYGECIYIWVYRYKQLKEKQREWKRNKKFNTQ